MKQNTWQHAELAPPPDGPQARARGDVAIVCSDGGVTVELTVRQLALPQGAEVALCCGDEELTRFTVAGGSGSHSQTLDEDQERLIEEGAELTIRRLDPETVGSGGVVAVEETDTALLHGILRETGDAS